MIDEVLWYAIMASAWESNSSERSTERSDGAYWDKPCRVRIRVDDPEKDGVLIVSLSPSLIMEAWDHVKANYRLSAGDVPGDLVIQYAMFMIQYASFDEIAYD